MTNRFRRDILRVGLCLSLFSAACGGKNNNPAGPSSTPGGGGSTGGGGGNTGTVTGRVTAADGQTGIGHVTVSPANAASPSTTTDATGNYTLTGVAAGAQSLRARVANFDATVSVNVAAGQSVAAPNAMLKAIGRMAFVRGAFDQIETLISGLGNTVDEIRADQLGTSATLSQYKMLFLNCGLDETPAANPALIQTLLAWVQAGGILYASDWALSYVKPMHNPSDFITIDELTSEGPLNADVIDASAYLQAFLGKNSASLVYDLAGWKGLQEISTRPRVLLRGTYKNGLGQTMSNKALALVLPEGNGKVVYSTFHYEATATPPPDQVAVLRYYIYIE